MPAPDLPGLTFEGTLGAGGYADVFAYAQTFPARRVAVKVLRDAAGAGSGAGSAFVAEANAMAALTHPHIVAVLAAGVAADGRPYLVMPLLPGPHLADLSSTGPLDVETVLRVGVQIAGAVETAHRGGVLHRDLKPANVLLDGYGTPLLADFGLAGSPADGDAADVGVSIPWTAPEVLFGDAPASVASDVYSLAATCWTLLAGRSPFEVPGRDNDAITLLKRIRTLPPRPTDADGVPAALDALLMRALAKDLGERPASALEFALALGTMQRDLALAVTEPVVPLARRPRAGASGVRPPVVATPAARVGRGSNLLAEASE